MYTLRHVWLYLKVRRLYLDVYTVVVRVMYNCTLETHMKVRPIVFRGMYRAFFSLLDR